MKQLNVWKIFVASWLVVTGVVQAEKALAKTPNIRAAKSAGVAIDARMYVPAHDVVELESYDAKTGRYHLKRQDYQSATGLYTTPQSLAKAVKSLDAAALLKRPASFVGNIYSTDDDLLLVDVVPEPSGK